MVIVISLSKYGRMSIQVLAVIKRHGFILIMMVGGSCNFGMCACTVILVIALRCY